MERQKAQDKILDAKVMTYNTDLNMYLYRNKAISRNDVGSEDGQMTLQEFKSKVDQTSTDDTNEFNETTKETSADGKVTRKFVDLKYDK